MRNLPDAPVSKDLVFGSKGCAHARALKSGGPDHWWNPHNTVPSFRIAEYKVRASEKNGRPVRTRTADLYRVNYEVQKLKPFACLAFPFLKSQKRPLKDLVLEANW